MATLDVVTIDNKKAGTVDLSAEVFEAKIREHLFHAEVRRQLAARRAGTHSTRNRALVSGGGAKPWRQKGTGRARQGTTRAPQWAGGGVVFGPVPRSHEHKLTKKMRRAALRGVLTRALEEAALTVVDEIQLEGFKTRRVVEILSALGIASKSVLIVVVEREPVLEGSVRNIPGVDVIPAGGLNVYDVLRHGHLVITRAAVDALEARLSGAGEEGAA